MAVDIATQVINTLMVLVGVCLVGVGGLLVFLMAQFKHSIVIREVTNNRKIIQIDKFKIWTDPKTGIEYYKTQKGKEQYPVAPKEAIEITKKGKMFVEAYKLPSGDLLYLEDTNADETAIMKSEAYKPITTSQRIIQYHMYENKIRNKRKSWKDMIVPIVGFASLTIIVVCLFIFWGDIAQPVLDMGDKVGNMMDKQVEIMETLKEIIQKEQIIDGAGGSSGQAPN